MLGPSLFPLQNQILPFVTARGKIYKNVKEETQMEGNIKIGT